MKVTLKTIAEESGRSISTVSRVLNGTGNISPEVQKKIVKIAEKFKYPFIKSKIPFYSNANLNVALITEFKEGEFYSSYFFGLSNAARQMDIRLTLIDVTNEDEFIINTINDLDPQRYDGICLFMPEMTNDFYIKLSRQVNNNIPIISNAMIQNPLIPTITFDGYSGGYLAAEHLLNKGYKSFGIVKGPFSKTESRYRYNGFKDYLEYNEQNILWETGGNFEFNSGEEAFNEFQKLTKKPKAIFISNDMMTRGFIEAAKHNGVRIPEELAIVSYDDLPVCIESYPKITSIKTDFYELGKTTLNTIKDLILKTDVSRSTLSLVSISLSDRESA
jgi:DNA-binding LacI/PurR family transcriptional regulator